MAALTPGFVKHLHKDFRGGLPGEVVFQVLGITPILADGEDYNTKLYAIQVSDSWHSTYLLLHPRLNDLVSSGRLSSGQFLAIQKIDPHSKFHQISQATVIGEKHMLLGTPEELPDRDFGTLEVILARYGVEENASPNNGVPATGKNLLGVDVRMRNSHEGTLFASTPTSRWGHSRSRSGGCGPLEASQWSTPTHRTTAREILRNSVSPGDDTYASDPEGFLSPSPTRVEQPSRRRGHPTSMSLGSFERYLRSEGDRAPVPQCPEPPQHEVPKTSNNKQTPGTFGTASAGRDGWISASVEGGRDRSAPRYSEDTPVGSTSFGRGMGSTRYDDCDEVSSATTRHFLRKGEGKGASSHHERRPPRPLVTTATVAGNVTTPVDLARVEDELKASSSTPKSALKRFQEPTVSSQTHRVAKIPASTPVEKPRAKSAIEGIERATLPGNINENDIGSVVLPMMLSKGSASKFSKGFIALSDKVVVRQVNERKRISDAMRDFNQMNDVMSNMSVLVEIVESSDVLEFESLERFMSFYATLPPRTKNDVLIPPVGSPERLVTSSTNAAPASPKGSLIDSFASSHQRRLSIGRLTSPVVMTAAAPSKAKSKTKSRTAGKGGSANAQALSIAPPAHASSPPQEPKQDTCAAKLEDLQGSEAVQATNNAVRAEAERWFLSHIDRALDNPRGFVEGCESYAGRSGQSALSFLRRIQELVLAQGEDGNFSRVRDVNSKLTEAILLARA